MTDYDDLLRRQRTLADFGDFVLRSKDLQEILTEGCRLVCGALGTKLGKVMEIEREKGVALVRAGVGWPEGVVGHVRLELSERSSETWAIEQGEPLVSANIHTEERFEFPDFLKEAGVVSLVNVPIFLPGGEPYGLLQVDHREPRDFSQDDIAFLRTYAAMLGPVIDRLHKVHELQVALQEKEALMDELQHRIKNNIAMIGSVVRLREKETSSEEARRELRLVGGRVEALRLVHEHLYAARERRDVQLKPYFEEMLDNLMRLNEAERRSVRCEVEVEAAELRLPSDKAIPLGLIVNEFATNSLKHAFGAEGGTIRLRLETEGERFRLTLSDDGRGLSERTTGSRAGSGTGMALINALARQIGATPSWPPSSAGVTLKLDVKR